MDKIILAIALCFFVIGCASTPRGVVRDKSETTSQQLDAAQKVVGGMTGKPVSREDMKRVAKDIRSNKESRSAVEKIIGAETAKPVVKYSPVTGKHYSGDLDVDPETGVKLEILPE
ncbi:MAG: hypothetical protein HQL16_07485 [Candidatus Omnitrophica bacterium]|nr:hypothetical protein [Candidatus Omnitrophota bacterium]